MTALKGSFVSNYSSEAKTKKRDKADSETHWKTLCSLSKYLWNRDRFDLRVRVILAIICLVLAKIVNVVVPFLYKGAVDQLSSPAALVLPLALIIAWPNTLKEPSPSIRLNTCINSPFAFT